VSDDLAICVRGLGKKYQIGGPQEKYLTLRDAIVNTMKAPFKRFNRASLDVGGFWALKDVSFDVKQGEVVGIIGRNGAGKSTLLKILSRITAPTEGSVELNGRVGSLLEVGTGFHPEMTGRENIFLNGSILGMKKTEIEEKFDEIVKFAEVEKFLDTPVKRYSSGMYVRLAFAVAAHLEPEILVVDEVLAVGDAEFQKKCLGKMGEVAKEGRTVLFVSHNMAAIRRICSRVILVDSGNISKSGDVDNIISYYLQNSLRIASYSNIQQLIDLLPADPIFKLQNIEIYQNGVAIKEIVENGKPLEIVIHYQIFKKTQGLRVYFDLCATDDTILFRSFHDEQSEGIPFMEPGEYISIAVIPANILGPIQYELRIHSGIHNIRSCLPFKGICISITVKNTGTYNIAYANDTFRGKLGLSIPWNTVKNYDTQKF
jgi:lipopolysaccharide transport system ATP-binding protein